MAATALLLSLNTAQGYSGRLNHVHGDIKRPLDGFQGRITNGNHRNIINGIRNNLMCNALRTSVLLDETRTSGYPSLHRTVTNYATGRGMRIYANPLHTPNLWPSNVRRNTFNDRRRFAERVATYVNGFDPDWYGPFNEAGFSTSHYINIRDRCVSAVPRGTRVVGTDVQHVDTSVNQLNNTRREFTIWGSHNAVGDGSATLRNWNRLADRAGREVWATENPRRFRDSSAGTGEIGVRSVVNSRVRGLTLYLAHAARVNTSGDLTSTGRDIRDGIGRRE